MGIAKFYLTGRNLLLRIFQKASSGLIGSKESVLGFPSVVDLQAAINRFIAEYNAAHPKPFIWTVKPDAIIAAQNSGFQTFESIH